MDRKQFRESLQRQLAVCQELKGTLQSPLSARHLQELEREIERKLQEQDK